MTVISEGKRTGNTLAIINDIFKLSKDANLDEERFSILLMLVGLVDVVNNADKTIETATQNRQKTETR